MAISEFRRFFNRFSDPIYLEAGKALLKKNNTRGAIRQFEKASIEDPGSEVGKEAMKLIQLLRP